MNRYELIDLFEKHNYLGKGVEVGTFQGKYANHILQKWKGKLYLVDVWNRLDDQEYKDASNNIEYEKIYRDCMENIRGNEQRCFMIRSHSKNAVDLFSDESLDFVYIDANHKYDFVKEDIEIWYPKVRVGGILAGHDYLDMNWYDEKIYLENGKDKHIWLNNDGNSWYAGVFGVNPAVDEFVQKNNLNLNKTSEWLGSWYVVK